MRSIAFCLLFLISGSILSQPDVDSLKYSDLEPFLDDLISKQLPDKIPGATISVVKNGEIIFLKGYGVVDVDNNVPVDPGKHLFRIGSISKLFVWTAIMQLYEQGKLDLNDDINKYLDFEIPDTYDEPIRIWNLMTHSPGFEDRLIGLFGRDESTMRPMKELLQEQLPERVYPPGYTSAYSNHGTGIAQYIVERVSGVDFITYVEENILTPLQMDKTSFQQPLPDNLEKDLSKGYVRIDGEFKEQLFEYVPLYGVGGASSTAENMAHFIIFHLQLGTYNEVQVLDSATARKMQSPAFYNTPEVNPMRYGFMDVSRNGKTIIGHGGDTGWFHSFMALYPEENLGFFVSYNSPDGTIAYFELVDKFTNHYFPEEVKPLEPALDKETLEREYAGFYAGNRFPRSTMAKMSKLAFSVNVEVTDEGLIRTNILGQDNEWIPVDSSVFRDKSSNKILLFKRNEAGEVRNLFVGDLPVFSFEKATGLDNPLYHFGIIAALLIVVILTLILWTGKFIYNKFTGQVTRNPRSIPLASKRNGYMISFLWLSFFTLIGVAIARDPIALAFEVPQLIQFSLIIPYIILLLVIIMGYQVIQIWRASKVTFFNKLYFTIMFLLFIDGIWIINYWNLLGFKF